MNATLWHFWQNKLMPQRVTVTVESWKYNPKNFMKGFPFSVEVVKWWKKQNLLWLNTLIPKLRLFSHKVVVVFKTNPTRKDRYGLFNDAIRLIGWEAKP